MNDLITMDLESPARLSSDDNSSDAIIERVERKYRGIRKTLATKAENKLAEVALCYYDMVVDDQLVFGRVSRYFFRMKRLEKSQMLMLKGLILKYS